MMLRKIAVIVMLLSIPLAAHAADEKSWYPFMQNKGWYPTEGQAGSTNTTADAGNSVVQPTTQTNTNTNTASSQGSGQPGGSNWFK